MAVLLTQSAVRLHLHWCGDVASTLQSQWRIDDTPQEPQGCCASAADETAGCCHHKVIAAKAPTDLSVPMPYEWSFWMAVWPTPYADVRWVITSPNTIGQPLCATPVFAHGPPKYVQYHQLLFYA